MRRSDNDAWPEAIFRTLKGAGVRQVAYVPDGGHKRLIELCIADKEMHTVVLSTEEEGIGLLSGAWLGGQRGVLLMLVTMRGQKGEFNPWQVPMGQATPAVLQAMDVVVNEANSAAEIAPTVDAAARLAFGSYQAVAVLISQAVIGIKSFQDQASR